MCDFLSGGEFCECLADGDRDRELVSLLRLRLCFDVVLNDDNFETDDDVR